MRRSLFGIAALVASASASVAAAQVPASVASGVGSFGGGYRPGTPALSAPVVRGPMFLGPRGGFGGRAGFLPGYGGGYPLYPYGGAGGGFITGNYYSPYFVVPGPFAYDLPPVPAGPPAPPVRAVAVSGEYPATLTLQYPAAATVWLDGAELPGPAAAERVVTSPVLRPGETHTFHVRARWEADGRAGESVRDVTLGPGDRSRLRVLAGTAVSEK